MPLATVERAWPATGAPVALETDPLEALARELDAIRDAVRADLGDDDRAYIVRVIAVQRHLELAGRALLDVGATMVVERPRNSSACTITA